MRRARRQTDIGTQPIPHETLAELAAAWREQIARSNNTQPKDKTP